MAGAPLAQSCGPAARALLWSHCPLGQNQRLPAIYGTRSNPWSGVRARTSPGSPGCRLPAAGTTSTPHLPARHFPSPGPSPSGPQSVVSEMVLAPALAPFLRMESPSQDLFTAGFL